MIPHKSQAILPAKNQEAKEGIKNSALDTLQLLWRSGKIKADLERELGMYSGCIHLLERAFNKELDNVERLERRSV